MNNQLAEPVNPAEVMKNRITEGVAVLHRKSAAVLMFEILDLVAASNVYKYEALSALEAARAMLPQLHLEEGRRRVRLHQPFRQAEVGPSR